MSSIGNKLTLVIHVERGDSEVIVFWGAVMLEQLGYLEDLTHRIRAIAVLVGLQLSHFLKQIVKFCGHGFLVCSEVDLGGGEFGNGFFDSMDVRLRVCGFCHWSSMKAPRC